MDGQGKKSSDVIWLKEQIESLLHLYEQEIELWDMSLCIAEFQQQLAKCKQG
jgi:hypothetical protein